MRNPTGPSLDRYGDAVRSTASRSDGLTRIGRPFLTRLVNAHGYPKYHAGPAAEPDLVFPPPPEPLVDSHGGRRFHVERVLNHRVKNGERTSYLVRWRGFPPLYITWDIDPR